MTVVMEDLDLDSPTFSYVDLLSAVRETNRCPGGRRTLARIVSRLGLHPGSRVLEIGSNTGFTSIEIARLSGARCHGIDVNPAAVAQADRWRDRLSPELASRVSFSVGDAQSTELAGESSYDAVICGGANSFIADRSRAFEGYHRVLRPSGSLSMTNLFYHSAPSPELREDLGRVLGFVPPAYEAAEWVDALTPAGWDLDHVSTTRMARRPTHVVDEYVDWLCSADRVTWLPEDVRSVVERSWRAVCHVFNENHASLGFVELVLRKPDVDGAQQPELFLEEGAFDPFFTRTFVESDLS